ncbi:hypothetical protein HHX47_DHR9000479 [Lentinula edodes]|nr:hypothetical protein HHX47_DHR9000479 [Lentinula edodes]
MPELPEVERAVKQIKRLALNKTIQRVETTEDNIVFSGITHEEFANEITGRKITGVKRYGSMLCFASHMVLNIDAQIVGKSFYLELDGQGKLPVLHFGMTGMLQVFIIIYAPKHAGTHDRSEKVKGEKPMYYKETPKGASTDWPPRFMKIGNLHQFTKFVCETAVSVDADATKFPEDWLFKHRWVSGDLATIKWVTVGGRTSAYVAELQQLTSQAPVPLIKKRTTHSHLLEKKAAAEPRKIKSKLQRKKNTK